MSPGSRPLGTLAWIDLATPDVDAAADFYARLLGWTLETDDPGWAATSSDSPAAARRGHQSLDVTP